MKGPGPVSLLGADPATYQRHPLHGPDRAYPETNCYADVMIELLHARGDEPIAAFGCTVGLDFEGDQFTFFKPPAAELEMLFGVDVHEMQPYRPLPQQALEQISAGRTLVVEMDAFYLPDTSGTSYREKHVKTSVAFETIDVSARVLRYFHNAGLFELDGDDYDGVFRLWPEMSADALPPYTELVCFDVGPRLAGEELRCAARDLLDHHLARRPDTNPFDSFGMHLGEGLPLLIAGGPSDFHEYAFATARMAGSAFEVAGSYAEWLLGEGGQPVAEAFGRIVTGCKALSFRLARGREFDVEPSVSALAAAWVEGQERLDAALN